MNKNIDAWHQVVASRDLTQLSEILADEVVFHSPVVHTPQRGKAITEMYLTAAFHVLVNDSFHYVREVINDEHAVLEFVVEVDGIMCNGVDMISWNEQGQIIDFKVMLRPYKAIELLKEKMRIMLESAG